MRAVQRLRPGLWRLVALNSLVIVVLLVVLAASPAPVHFPSDHWEALMLAGAAVLMIAANLLLAGAAVAASVERGRRARTETRELEALRRAEHFDVFDGDGLIGIVDEVLGDRAGREETLVVSHGWFGARRFLVPAATIDSIDETRRIVQVDGTTAAGDP